jgi:hypothetical protein
MVLVRTDVSEEHIASIFRVTKLFKSSKLTTSICLTTDGEDSHICAYPLPWIYR